MLQNSLAYMLYIYYNILLNLKFYLNPMINVDVMAIHRNFIFSEMVAIFVRMQGCQTQF